MDAMAMMNDPSMFMDMMKKNMVHAVPPPFRISKAAFAIYRRALN